MNVYDPMSESEDHSTTALRLQRLSNVAEPGLWVFRVDEAIIQSGGQCTWLLCLIHNYILHCVDQIL